MNPPDLLISDIGMPGQDGYQLIAAVRGLEGPARAVPAIAVTAFAGPQDRVVALQSGYNMHVAKPINAARACYRHRQIEVWRQLVVVRALAPASIAVRLTIQF